MDALNTNFDFSKTDRETQLAFRGSPRRVLFEPGDRLYRFTSLPDQTFAGNEIFKSPWWQPHRTFNAILRTANRTRSSIVDTARSGLAVNRTWNPTMEWLVIVELTSPVYGWAGRTRHQPAEGADRSVLLMGNFTQVFVPGLAGGGDGNSSPFGFICYHGSVAGV
jgi:hypothetical protein